MFESAIGSGKFLHELNQALYRFQGDSVIYGSPTAAYGPVAFEAIDDEKDGYKTRSIKLQTSLTPGESTTKPPSPR